MSTHRPIRPTVQPDIAGAASLIADPARAAMLFALLDGGELAASELASRGGASRQAASAHLGKLVAGGLLEATALGRQRLFRLASPEIAHAMEALAAIARPAPLFALSQHTKMERLREARSCYDHLAGRLGVAVTEYFLECDAIRIAGGTVHLTHLGEKYFRRLGIDVQAVRARPRAFARTCTDWTERRPHLAGSLGAAVLERFFYEGWVVRTPRDRALRITPEGRTALQRRFHIRLLSG